MKAFDCLPTFLQNKVRFDLADAPGCVTQMGYDSLGRLTTSTDALGQVSRTEYDAAGNVTRRVDALNRSTTLLTTS
jgi:YD repeat-containing protein